jgi:type IV pilus assembly protein PilA
MKKIQKGFTLIELMIVIAIIGILAAIAIPAYNDYVTRSQVTEGMSLASGMKTQVAEFHANNGSWPITVADLPDVIPGTPNAPANYSGRYVQQIEVRNGTLVITYGVDANQNIALAGQNLVAIQPYLNDNGDVVWVCGNAITDVALLANLDPRPTLPPAGTPSDTVTSTVLDKYMPANCRAP